MAALLASCPQAVRIVRPLCWMLGIAQADFVPGPAVAEPADSPVASVARVAPILAASEHGLRLAQGLVGTDWGDFIPG
jgi:hypothetical protein